MNVERLIYRAPIALLVAASSSGLVLLAMLYSSLLFASALDGLHVLYPESFFVLLGMTFYSMTALALSGPKISWGTLASMFGWALLICIAATVAGVAITTIDVTRVVATGQYGDILHADVEGLERVDLFSKAQLVLPPVVLVFVFVVLWRRALRADLYPVARPSTFFAAPSAANVWLPPHVHRGVSRLLTTLGVVVGMAALVSLSVFYVEQGHRLEFSLARLALALASIFGPILVLHGGYRLLIWLVEGFRKPEG